MAAGLDAVELRLVRAGKKARSASGYGVCMSRTARAYVSDGGIPCALHAIEVSALSPDPSVSTVSRAVSISVAVWSAVAPVSMPSSFVIWADVARPF